MMYPALVTLSALAAAQPPAGMVVGSVSEPLLAADNSTYLIFLPPTWKATGSYPVMLFLHGGTQAKALTPD